MRTPLLLVALALAAGCAAQPVAGSPPTHGSPGPGSTAPPTAPGTPPGLSCTSAGPGAPYSPGAPVTTGLRLGPTDRVVAALLCRTDLRVLPGQGEQAVRLEQRPSGAALDRLVAALREPDAPPPGSGTACPAIAFLPPDLQLLLADGRVVRPPLPVDGCHLPRSAVERALADLGPEQVVPAGGR